MDGIAFVSTTISAEGNTGAATAVEGVWVWDGEGMFSTSCSADISSEDD